METYAALRRRRMVRSFEDRPVEAAILERVVDAGLRGPSAGHTQAIELLVLTAAADRAAFWEAETDGAWRDAHPGHARTRRAPAIVLPLTGPRPYLERYSAPDKAGSGLAAEEAWPLPYWWFDAGAAVMAVLLAAADEGLAALLMGVFRGEPALRARFGYPEHLRPAGALLLGWPGGGEVASPSLARGRRPAAERIHAGRYGSPAAGTGGDGAGGDGTGGDGAGGD